MRARNTSSNLQVYGVAGTHTAVLAMDFATRPEGLLGLAFERQDLASGRITWLEGQKCFKSLVPAPVPGQKYPTHLHPVQGLFWKDFTLQPGRSYRYKVTPVFGSPASPAYGPATELTLAAEPEWDGQHGVYFNRGVSGSQAYAEHFPPGKISALKPAERERALLWLSRGLLEGLGAFIARAKKGDTLLGAFYECQEPRALALLKAAHARGVKVQLVVDGQQYGEDNRAALADAGMLRLVKTWRIKAKIAHNKFIVRLSSSGRAQEVWTGSTNLSPKGLFGQCNTGHALRNPTLAARYLACWQALQADPARAALVDVVMALQPDLAAAALPRDRASVFFSPRRDAAMLDSYAALVAGAKQLACGIFPFNVDARFQAAFNAPKDFPRYVIVDKKAQAFTPNDSDLDVAAGAAIKSPVDQWLKEQSAASLFNSGTDYVHNKLLLVDPLGPEPVIVVGSANFSVPSTNANDENMLVLKGPAFRREADIYLTEFIRLFDHFNFRDWLNTPDRAAFQPFLEEGPQPGGWSWLNKYIGHPQYLSHKRKLVFRNMVV
jgi:hypothetical protein